LLEECDGFYGVSHGSPTCGSRAARGHIYKFCVCYKNFTKI